MQSDLIWARGPVAEGRILIDAQVITTINKYRQDYADKPEAGGILIGYRRGEHLHIAFATEPSDDDSRSRYSFERVSHSHQRQATEHWSRSGGTIDYLGEWHSHPETYPTPSTLDRSEWSLICRKRAAPMVFVIIGITGELWLGCSDELAVRRCDIIDR